MRMRLVFVIGLLLSIWLTSSVWADYVDSVVLIPNADGAFNSFDSSSAGAAHWTCVNDSCSDANRCDTDTSAKLYGQDGTEQYRITEPADTADVCDSMAIYCNWAEQRTGTSGEFEIMYGWRMWSESVWTWCPYHGGLDTVIVNGPTCTIYRKSWTKNPYFPADNPISYYWFAGYLDDHEENNALQPAFTINTWETGCFASNCVVALFDVWVVFYFTVTEAEGQVIIISDAPDFHRPPIAYLNWREQ